MRLKPILFVIFVIIIPTLLVFLSFKLDLRQIRRAQNPPILIKQGKVADLDPQQLAGHPQLFYADLEYNPATDTVTQLKTGNTSGDIPQLLDQVPTSSSARLNLKIETIGENKKLLHLGWITLFKEVIKTPEGTFKFQITTVYQPKTTVNVYLQGKRLIWTTKI